MEEVWNIGSGKTLVLQAGQNLLPARPKLLRIYVLSFTLILVTLGLRLSLPYDQPVFTLFLIPIVITAYLGGLMPGLVSTIITAIVTCYFVLPPYNTFKIAKNVNLAQWLTFIMDGVLLSILSEALIRSRARAEQRARDQTALQAEAHRLNERQNLLLECSRLILEFPNSGRELTQALFARVREHLNVDVCVHYRLHENKKLQLITCLGVPEAYMDKARNLNLGESYCGHVAITREPLTANRERIASDPKGAILHAMQVTAYACHPLLDRNRKVLGTLSIASTKRDGFTPEEIEFFQTLCQLVGVASERTEAVNKLRESEARLRAALDAGGIGTWTVDIVKNWTQWDEALSQMYGRACSAEGMDRSAFFDHIHPDDRPAVERAAQECAKNNQDYDIEYRYLRPDGNIVWIESRARIECDAEGHPIRLMGASVDVTQRKKLEEQYRHAQKMEAVGQLAAGVAHDFNNLLTVITGYSELMLQRLPEKDPLRMPVNSIHTAGQRAASLTQQLLAFSRKQVLEPKILDLNDIIVQTARMLQRLIGEDIRLASVLAPELSRVKLDPSQIEQVLMNLAVNARDAMPKGGLITMETANIRLDDAYVQTHPDCKPGPYVVLTVSDTGSGMTPDVKARIFEPFFTTKGIGKGTGLGLATVFGIVKQSDGHIEVVSELNSGTSFKIYFPAESTPLPALDTHARHVMPDRGHETILVVEDEKDLRMLIREVLEDFGYRVHTASCGSEAMEWLAKNPEPIQLLLTDVVLPEMSGHTIAKRITQKFPAVKVLYMSGYIADDVLRHGIVAEQVEFIHKPFSPLALANRVREVLDREVVTETT